MSRSPIKYHGGKSSLADWIVSLMPEHIHYVEPYCGGLSVLFSKTDDLIEGHSEVVNDINAEIINFFRILQSDIMRDELLRSLALMPFSEEVFEQARRDSAACKDSTHRVPSLACAIDFFVKNRQSRQGLGKDFATLSRNRTRRGMNEQVSSWLAAVDGLPEFCERLKRVVILNRDALSVIGTQDGPNTLFYLDPPYFPDTRVAGEYDHEMTPEGHEKLLELLENIEGKFLLSGYHCQLYDEWAARNGFEVFEKQTVAHSSSSKSKPMRTEVVWRKQ